MYLVQFSDGTTINLDQITGYFDINGGLAVEFSDGDTTEYFRENAEEGLLIDIILDFPIQRHLGLSDSQLETIAALSKKERDY